MSRAFWRRLLITAVLLLVGLLLAEGIRILFFPQFNGWTLYFFVGTLAAALGLYLDASLRATDERVAVSSRRSRLSSHLEADLLQLNRELEERARVHQNELARLNVELSLQMAQHQQAEDAARLSEERFRNLADNIQEGLSIIENGKLVYINDRVCEIFGKCPEGDLWQRVHEFALPEESERVNAILKTELPSELEYWICRADGESRCLREHYSSVQLEEGNVSSSSPPT
jgi:PAS domain S-box-containing protein